MKLSLFIPSAVAACLLVGGARLATAQSHQLDPQLRQLAEKEAPAVLQTLRVLTSVDSGTGQGAGMEAVASRIEAIAREIGGQVRRVRPAGNVAGPNLVIEFPGKGTRKVMLMSHMDTVYPPGTASQRPFRIDGNRAIAPGIADNKGGIAVFLHTVKLLKERGFEGCGRITMVFNSDEERGSVGSRDLIRSEAAASDVVLSGEPTADVESTVLGTSGVGNLTAKVRADGGPAGAEDRSIEEIADLILRTQDTARPLPETRMNWTLLRAENGAALKPASPAHRIHTATFQVTGRSSHAGVAPDEGVNAITELADLIARVGESLGRLGGIPWRWQLASGGLVGNVIPNRAQAILEFAVPPGMEARKATEAIEDAAGRRRLARAEISVDVTAAPARKLEGPTGAMAYADMRVPNAEVFEQLRGLVQAASGKPKFASTTTEVRADLGFPAFNSTPAAKALIAVISEINEQLGGKPLRILPRTYGATDAAWASQSGKPVVESLGLPGWGYHSSDDEYIFIDRIPRRVALVAETLRAICQR